MVIARSALTENVKKQRDRIGPTADVEGKRSDKSRLVLKILAKDRLATQKNNSGKGHPEMPDSMKPKKAPGDCEKLDIGAAKGLFMRI